MGWKKEELEVEMPWRKKNYARVLDNEKTKQDEFVDVEQKRD